tara:strand:+ start:4238 stop:4414 length:177 start_codon:yes stop_codon:yes gene_type:complete
MQVGDLVVQLGWEADGVGIVTKIWTGIGYVGHEQSWAAVQWPQGACDMNWNQLKVINK